jgi:hypothetical protein
MKEHRLVVGSCCHQKVKVARNTKPRTCIRVSRIGGMAEGGMAEGGMAGGGMARQGLIPAARCQNMGAAASPPRSSQLLRPLLLLNVVSGLQLAHTRPEPSARCTKADKNHP